MDKTFHTVAVGSGHSVQNARARWIGPQKFVSEGRAAAAVLVETNLDVLRPADLDADEVRTRWV